MIQTKIRKPLKALVPTATSSKSKIQIGGPSPTQAKVIQIQSNNSQSQVLLEQAPQTWKSVLLPRPQTQTTLVQMQAPGKSQTQIHVDGEHDYTKNTESENVL